MFNKALKLLTLSTLTSAAAATENSSLIIGYLTDPKYELQNTYLLNFFKRISDSGEVALFTPSVNNPKALPLSIK